MDKRTIHFMCSLFHFCVAAHAHCRTVRRRFTEISNKNLPSAASDKERKGFQSPVTAAAGSP